MNLTQKFDEIGALLESLSDRDNVRHAETQALKTAVAFMAAMLHANGSLDGRKYIQLLNVPGAQPSPATAKLAELADLIELMITQNPGKVSRGLDHPRPT